MSIPILFFVKSDAEEGSFGICSGPVEMSKLERVEGAHCQEIRRLGTHQRRRDDPPEGDPTFRLVNDPVIDYYAPDDGAEVSFAGEFGETECLLFDFGGRNYEPSSWEFARFVVHEAFHHHQLFDAKWKVPVGYDPATPPCTDPTNSRLASEEGRLIEVAALAENDEDTLRFVQRFIQMRTERFERWPEIEMLERGTEQVEGSARYVENQYSRCNGRASRLNMPPEALRADRDWLDFGRLYRSGARMLEILDRFEVDWRKRLTAGDDPYGILREVFEDR